MRNKWIAWGVLMVVAVSAGAQEYRSALPGYAFTFPRDYFNHEEYQTEWWYYTGNLRAKDGHRFGFELTFFRQGVSRAASANPWFVRDLWMAHLALSDIDGRRFHHEERINRSGPGLAGVDEEKGLVWNGNWRAQISEQREQLWGVAPDFDFALQLIPKKQPVPQGQNGVSQKAAGKGHASHYFSLTRLITSGHLEADGKSYEVEGASWMDHEFFTGSMSAEESGWDWISAQFEDGTELMLYRLRHRDGSVDPYSSGSFVDAQGKVEFLTIHDFALTPGSQSWTSPTTKAVYPQQWHISIPRLQLEADITTPLADQELTSRFGPSYWEGAVDLRGMRAGAEIRGSGYLEMTGYANPGRALLPQ